MAVRCIAQVCEAYRRDKSIRPVFRPPRHAPRPADHELQGAGSRQLSTLEGRILIPVVMGKYQAERFTNAKGQADLVPAGGRQVVPAGDGRRARNRPRSRPPTSSGSTSASRTSPRPTTARTTRATRSRHAVNAAGGSASVPADGHKAHKAESQKVPRGGARFRGDESHCIAKKKFTKAKDTARAIAVEDLGGIGARANGSRGRGTIAPEGLGVLPAPAVHRRRRRHWRASPWSRSIRATPAAHAPSAGVVARATGRQG